MKIAIGCDHGALTLKNSLIAHLKEKGHEVTDFGTYTDASCDYPVYGRAAAEAVASGACERGIVLCTTGIGMSICANKVRGIRCALLSDVRCAELTRLHNDTNVMALGSLTVTEEQAMQIADVWLGTAFSGEARHCKRIDMVMELEK